MKTEVYSWRVSADLKTALEREARRRKASVSALLDLAARDLLRKSDLNTAGEEEQLRLHKAAAKCFGTLASGNPYRSENASQDLKQILRKKHAR